MYLSRLILNPQNRRMQRELANVYEMHRTILRAFPEDLSDEERVLFRLEDDTEGGLLVILVQSNRLPDWSFLDEPTARGYLLPTVEANPAVKDFNLQLRRGQTLRFRLLANPTVKRKDQQQDKRQGKRHGLFKPDEQVAWLHRKGEQGGFRVLTARTSRQSNLSGRLHRDQHTHRLRFFAVQFDGVLQVTDAEQLLETMQQGIGSGKGFGFGLLSLAPMT